MKTFRQLQEEIRLTEAPAKAVVFMFGRFNPPTLGHEKMVKRAIAVAKQAGIREVRLYPGFSQDPKLNPLPHREKVKWLRKFFKGVKVVVDSDAHTPFAVARKLSDEGVKRVIFVVGGDRVKYFQTKITPYVKHPDPEKSFEFDEFQVVSAGERDPDAEDATGMSASKMREFVRLGDLSSFRKGMPSVAKSKDTFALFMKLRDSMNLSRLIPMLESEQSLIKQLKSLKSPDIAEDGKCYSVVWADGRGIVAYRNRADALQFLEQGDRDAVSVRYQDAVLPSGKPLIVRNKFSPDRSTIDEEWPGTLETHDDHLFAINEEFRQLDEKIRGQDKWWYDSRTNKSISINKNYHVEPVLADPKKFGLDPTVVDVLVPPDKRRDDVIPPLEKFMKKQGWVEVTWNRGVNEGVFRALNSRTAQKAVNWYLDTVNPSPDKVTIAHRGVKDFVLKKSQITAFARTGKVVRLSPLAAFREDQFDEGYDHLVFWFNPKNKKFIKVTTSYHDQEIIKNPKPFGLTKDDVHKLYPDAEEQAEVRDLFPHLHRPLLKAGWVKVSFYAGSGGQLNLKANTLAFVSNVAKVWLRRYPEPKHTYVDYGPNYKTLDKVQLRGLARTGKIPQPSRVAAFREERFLIEKLPGQDKWWYNAKKRKSVVVKPNWHDWEVVRDPKQFGLAQDFFEKMGLTRTDLATSTVLWPVQEYLLTRNWTQVTWSANGKELLIRGGEKSDVVKTLNWFLDKVNPSPETFRPVFHGSPDEMKGEQIHQYAKTGRVMRARF